MASDATKFTEVNLVENGGYQICINPQSREEAEMVYEKLAENGRVYMPLDEAPWAELAAMFTDKYGIQWMISYEEV